MELPHVTNAPRELSLGGLTYRARALTLADLGEVLAWLEDYLPPGEDGGRAGPLRFATESSQLALATTEGLAVVLHLALLPCHPSLTRDDARRLAAGMTAEDEARLRSIAFRRRPSYGGSGGGEPKDLAEIRWGEVFAALTRNRAELYGDVGRLSLDQYDNHAAKGEVGYPDDLDPADVQRMYEAALARPDAEAEKG